MTDNVNDNRETMRRAGQLAAAKRWGNHKAGRRMITIVPPDMADRVEAEARVAGISASAWIVRAIKQSLPKTHN